MNIILAKSSNELAIAAHCGPFDIVACPDPIVSDARVIQTALFTEPHLDHQGTVIESVDRRRHLHVAGIVNEAAVLAVALAKEDEIIYFLSADVRPPEGWRGKLRASISGNIGMACAAVPDPANLEYIKASPGVGRQHREGSISGLLKIYAGTIDCCAFTKKALADCLPIHARNICLEVGIADAMAQAAWETVLVANLTCGLR